MLEFGRNRTRGLYPRLEFYGDELAISQQTAKRG
jgi:hypothetical protein